MAMQQPAPVTCESVRRRLDEIGRGAGEPLDDGARQHLAGCDACATVLAGTIRDEPVEATGAVGQQPDGATRTALDLAYRETASGGHPAGWLRNRVGAIRTRDLPRVTVFLAALIAFVTLSVFATSFPQRTHWPSSDAGGMDPALFDEGLRALGDAPGVKQLKESLADADRRSDQDRASRRPVPGADSGKRSRLATCVAQLADHFEERPLAPVGWAALWSFVHRHGYDAESSRRLAERLYGRALAAIPADWYSGPVRPGTGPSPAGGAAGCLFGLERSWATASLLGLNYWGIDRECVHCRGLRFRWHDLPTRALGRLVHNGELGGAGAVLRALASPHWLLPNLQLGLCFLPLALPLLGLGLLVWLAVSGDLRRRALGRAAACRSETPRGMSLVMGASLVAAALLVQSVLFGTPPPKGATQTLVETYARYVADATEALGWHHFPVEIPAAALLFLASLAVVAAVLALARPADRSPRWLLAGAIAPGLAILLRGCELVLGHPLLDVTNVSLVLAMAAFGSLTILQPLCCGYLLMHLTPAALWRIRFHIGVLLASGGTLVIVFVLRALRDADVPQFYGAGTLLAAAAGRLDLFAGVVALAAALVPLAAMRLGATLAPEGCGALAGAEEESPLVRWVDSPVLLALGLVAVTAVALAAPVAAWSRSSW